MWKSLPFTWRVQHLYSGWDLGHAPAGAWWLAQFISAGSTLPSTSRTDFSRLERAVPTGRGTQPTVAPPGHCACCAGCTQTLWRQLKKNESDGPSYSHRSLEGDRARRYLYASGRLYTNKTRARGGVTSFLPSSTKKDGRRARRVVTRESPPAAVRGPIRVSPPPPSPQ
jgi:hypothetical protein